VEQVVGGLYQNILNHLLEGVYVVDRDRKILYWNQKAERITGYLSEEVVGHSCQENLLVHVDGEGNNLCKGLCPLAKTMMDAQPRNALVFLHHKQGHRVAVNVRTIPFHNDAGEIVGGIELFRQVSEDAEEMERIQKLEKMAFIDELTQLPNRRFFLSTLQRKLVEWQHFHSRSALFIADIDHFKRFNDSYGHDVGDRVLQTVARTLSGNVRGGDLVCRWGGEEFSGLLVAGKSSDLLTSLERLRMLVEKSFLMLEGKKVQVSVTIGASFVRNGDDGDSWMKRADSLLYSGKQKGRNRVCVDETY